MVSKSCKHGFLQTEVSAHADEVGYIRPPLQKRIAATIPSGRVPKTTDGQNTEPDESLAFPGPLILPDDALAGDPKEPPQSLRSWIREKARNPLTQRRKTVYLAEVPKIEAEISIMKSWAQPVPTPEQRSDAEVRRVLNNLPAPQSEPILEYLEAFYHGLPVKMLPNKFSFVAWGKKRPKQAPDHVGLLNGSTNVQVRTRPCPDEVFSRQLNLNDILDAVIDNVPDDAHSVLLMVDHDMYEDEDDDFCCGRAYGGSRVAVVSSARYHPIFDDAEGIDTAHMWPTSHCGPYVALQCNPGAKKLKASTKSGAMETGPLAAAIRAATMVTNPHDPYALWVSRVARTASHELGHCMALGHCVYYACIMQSTASTAEDVRQPPYLCPVCLSKITRAVLDVKKEVTEGEYAEERYRALLSFCQKWKTNAMFAGYAAWLDSVLKSHA